MKNQSINQSNRVNQSIDQIESINQSIDQVESINQSNAVNQSINQSVNLWKNQSINREIEQRIDHRQSFNAKRWLILTSSKSNCIHLHCKIRTQRKSILQKNERKKIKYEELRHMGLLVNGKKHEKFTRVPPWDLQRKRKGQNTGWSHLQ